jgi:hypothetical protein
VSTVGFHRKKGDIALFQKSAMSPFLKLGLTACRGSTRPARPRSFMTRPRQPLEVISGLTGQRAPAPSTRSGGGSHPSFACTGSRFTSNANAREASLA